MDPNLVKIYNRGNKKVKTYVCIIQKLLQIKFLVNRKITYGLILYYLQLCKKQNVSVTHIEKFKRFIPIHVKLFAPSNYLAKRIKYLPIPKLIIAINHMI